MSNEDNSRMDNMNEMLGPSQQKNVLASISKTFSMQSETSKESNSPIKEIQCRVEFVNFGEVDTFHEQFKAFVIIRSRWYETEKIEEYDKKKQWNPKLYIQNLIPEKFYENVTYKVTQLEDKTEITEIRSCKGTFWERMELMDFPMDIQELSIVVESNHNPKHVRLVPDSEKISRLSSDALNSFRDQQKYKLYEMVRISDTSSYDNPDTAWLKKNNKMSSTAESVVQLKEPRRSKFCATCFVSRNPGYYIMNVYSFNCLITILTLTLFIIDVESADKRITGTFKLILTLFTFKIVTSKALPTISYLTSLDKYQMINITYLALCCLWHSIVTSLNVNEVYKNRADNSAFGALIVFFVTIQVVFTFGFFRSYQKIKKLEKEELQFLTECATNPNDLEEYDDED